MPLRFAALLVAVLLCACTTEPELSRPDVGPRAETTVYDAIKKVAASDQQRLSILDAYDSSNGRLRSLAAQSRQVLARWRGLDRTAPDFSAQVDALAAQWAAVNADEMKTRAAFERSVATALSPAQWSTWQDFMRGRGAAEREQDDYGEGGMRRRRD